MDTVYLLKGSELRRMDNTLAVIYANGKKRRLPVMNVKHLVIPQACKLNSDVLSFLGRSQVRISFLDYYGNYTASLEPAEPYASGAVHLAQAAMILDPRKRLTMAKTIMEAAAHNISANIQYYVYRGGNPRLRDTQMAINQQRIKLEGVQSVEELMGVEGQLRQIYYSAWGYINPQLTMVKRTRRPPADKINALISFGNGLMYSACHQALSQSHLDQTLSFIHAPTQARASLALDVAEIFKPVVIDRLIFRLINRKELDQSDFDEQEGICLLTPKGREKMIESFRQDMDITRVGEMTGYRSVLLKEAYKIEAHLLEMEEYAPYRRRV